MVETVYKAERSLERMRGLLGRTLQPKEGFLLEPCNSVHTWFMSYPIDVVFLNKRGIILKIVHSLGPWKMAASWTARACLELPAGYVREQGLSEGQYLLWGDGA